MKHDLQVGTAMHNTLGDVVEGFKQNDILSNGSLRLFGSMREAAITKRAPDQAVHDLDILCLFPEMTPEIDSEVRDLVGRASENNSGKDIIVEPFYVHKPADMTPPKSGKKVIVHFQMFDPSKLDLEFARFRHSLTHHGTQIYGASPNEHLVERIGLQDISDEPGIRIDMLRKIDSKKDKVKYCMYGVMNLASNLLNVFHPYTSWPHFEKGTDCVNAFRKSFPNLQRSEFPLELMGLQHRFRNGENVSFDGVETESLNYFAAVDQMMRNIQGN